MVKRRNVSISYHNTMQNLRRAPIESDTVKQDIGFHVSASNLTAQNWQKLEVQFLEI